MGKLFLIVQGSFGEGFRLRGPINNSKLNSLNGPEVIEVTTPDGGIADPDGMALLLRGDPILEGFEAIGPFTNIQDATAYGLVNEEGNWWAFMSSHL